VQRDRLREGFRAHRGPRRDRVEASLMRHCELTGQAGNSSDRTYRSRLLSVRWGWTFGDGLHLVAGADHGQVELLVSSFIEVEALDRLANVDHHPGVFPEHHQLVGLEGDDHLLLTVHALEHADLTTRDRGGMPQGVDDAGEVEAAEDRPGLFADFEG